MYYVDDVLDVKMMERFEGAKEKADKKETRHLVWGFTREKMCFLYVKEYIVPKEFEWKKRRTRREKWCQLPGAKMQKGKTPEEILKKVFMKEYNMPVDVGDLAFQGEATDVIEEQNYIVDVYWVKPQDHVDKETKKKFYQKFHRVNVADFNVIEKIRYTPIMKDFYTKTFRTMITSKDENNGY